MGGIHQWPVDSPKKGQQCSVQSTVLPENLLCFVLVLYVSLPLKQYYHSTSEVTYMDMCKKKSHASIKDQWYDHNKINYHITVHILYNIHKDIHVELSWQRPIYMAYPKEIKASVKGSQESTKKYNTITKIECNKILYMIFCKFVVAHMNGVLMSFTKLVGLYKVAGRVIKLICRSIAEGGCIQNGIAWLPPIISMT